MGSNMGGSQPRRVRVPPRFGVCARAKDGAIAAPDRVMPVRARRSRRERRMGTSSGFSHGRSTWESIDPRAAARAGDVLPGHRLHEATRLARPAHTGVPSKAGWREPLPYVPVEAGAIGTSPASGSGDRLRILPTEKNFPRLESCALFRPAIDALTVPSHVRILSEIIDALPRASSPPSMVTDRFGSVGRYAIAVVAIAGATLLHSLLFSFLGERAHFIIYFPAIVFAAWAGGLGPGLLSTALACLLVWYAFTAPRFSFALADPAAPAQLWIFLFFGALTCVLAEGMRRAGAERKSSTRASARKRRSWKMPTTTRASASGKPRAWQVSCRPSIPSISMPRFDTLPRTRAPCSRPTSPRYSGSTSPRIV